MANLLKIVRSNDSPINSIRDYNRQHDHSHDVRDASSILREIKVAQCLHRHG